MTGEQGRKVFLNDQSLDLGEGYKILSGVAPRLSDIDIKTDGIGDDTGAETQEFVNRLLLLLRKERVADGEWPCVYSHCLLTSFSSALPVLLDDLNDRMLDWGTKGKISPFNEVYDVCSILFPYPPLS